MANKIPPFIRKGTVILSGILMMVTIVFILAQPVGFAQQDTAEDFSIVLPAKNVEDFIGKLLPYEINLGKGFSGLFFLKSINNIKIFEDKIAFSSHIHGENVTFKTKLGKQEAVLSFGNIDLRNRWDVTYRYDPDNKILHVTPHLINPETKESSSQGEMLLTALFGGISDMEYPIDLKELPPVATRVVDKNLTIHFDVTDIRSTNDRLTIFINPIPKIGATNKK